MRAADLTGRRFGRLTVLSESAHVNSRRTWLCLCDCGNQTTATTSHLTGGSTTSCGCARKGVNRIDITGQRFGRLIALTPTERRLGHSVIWRCQCDCGNTPEVAAINLRNGNTQSCGCLSSEVHSAASGVMRESRRADYVDGTDVQKLLQSPGANNTSGVVGVSYDKSIRAWKAHIQFKGRRYFLGSSVDKDVATALRKQAEQKLHGEFLAWYYSQHPERNPDRGASEPPE